MRKIIILFAVINIVAILYFYFLLQKKSPVPKQTNTPVEKPLLAYTFDNLSKTVFPKTQITLGKAIETPPETTAQIFYFETPVAPGKKEVDRVSGVMYAPDKPGQYPVIVMFRGYIPDEQYMPGAGTKHAAEVLAKSGYITLAPDFLGFGESDAPSKDTFEARFQTYTTALSLLASIPTLNDGIDSSYSGKISADTNRIGIWGHSNGGHIALSTLAISSKSYPTVLWAPVSKPFPYSILYYSDEAPDHGKALRVVLANFERIYDVDLFSPDNFYKNIAAPVSIHQGVSDKAVPVEWSTELVAKLKEEHIDADLHTYEGDHNMLPKAWDSVINDSIIFFNKQLK